jgi:site-specific DNA-cytosine methylase
MSRGLEAAGLTPMAHCEIAEHARAVLRYRWPKTPLYGDVLALNGRSFQGAAIVSGGSA